MYYDSNIESQVNIEEKTTKNITKGLNCYPRGLLMPCVFLVVF